MGCSLTDNPREDFRVGTIYDGHRHKLRAYPFFDHGIRGQTGLSPNFLSAKLADPSELPDFPGITGSLPTPEEFCLKLAYGGRPLHGHEFRCQTSEGNFQLRTLWVVTLCFAAANDSFA